MPFAATTRRENEQNRQKGFSEGFGVRGGGRRDGVRFRRSEDRCAAAEARRHPRVPAAPRPQHVVRLVPGGRQRRRVQVQAGHRPSQQGRPLAQGDRLRREEGREHDRHRSRRRRGVSEPSRTGDQGIMEPRQAPCGSSPSQGHGGGGDSEAQLFHLAQRVAQAVSPHDLHAGILQGLRRRAARRIRDIRQPALHSHRLRRGVRQPPA